MHPLFLPTAACLSIFIVLIGVNELSFRAGKRAKLAGGPKPELGGVSGALLGLLGLLLAFSFSSSAQRFIDRQDLVVKEANALGTAWLRAGAMPAPERDVLRARLIDYADARIALADAGADPNAIEAAQKAAAHLHKPLWEAGLAAVMKSPDKTMLMLPPLNDIIDLHTTRASAMGRHSQPVVLATLGIASAAAIMLLGYSTGLTGRRHALLHSAFALLVAGVLWLTIDLDHPRVGLIRANYDVLVDARAAMTP